MRTLNDYFVTAEIEDISTASSTFVAVPDGGRIIKIITALQGAISGGNAAISFEIGGTAVTGGALQLHIQDQQQVMLIQQNQQHLTESKKMELLR